MKTSAVLCSLVVLFYSQSEVSANQYLMFFLIILNVSVVLILAYCSVNEVQFLASSYCSLFQIQKVTCLFYHSLQKHEWVMKPVCVMADNFFLEFWGPAYGESEQSS